MPTADSLRKIQTIWTMRISHRLARGEGVRESFQQQLGRLFELLIQALETGNPEWLDPLIASWAEARTETDLGDGEQPLVIILNLILQISCEVARENLPPAEALELIQGLLPVYAHAVNSAYRLEVEHKARRISRELEKTKQALKRLEGNRSDFISVAAHELKTPLTLIEGYLAMLREQIPDAEGDPQTRVLLQGVQKGTRRLQEIIDDMIDVAMIENRLLALNFQPVWIDRLIEMVIHEMSPALQERQQTLELIPFEGMHEMIFGDSERLYQALRNVVSNAIKYTPDEGRITLSGRLLPGFIEVTIQDTGIGINPEDHAWVFEKFGRLGETSLHSSGKTKFKGGGPGLGLPITKGIIEAHGGAIWIESEGRDEIRCPGTTFHILLPLRKDTPDERAARFVGTE